MVELELKPSENLELELQAAPGPTTMELPNWTKPVRTQSTKRRDD